MNEIHKFRIEQHVDSVAKSMLDQFEKFPGSTVFSWKYPSNISDMIIPEILKRLGSCTKRSFCTVTQDNYSWVEAKPKEADMKVNIRKCARCLGDHDKLEFFKLHNPQEEWGYWAMCPNTRQPVMLAVV